MQHPPELHAIAQGITEELTHIPGIRPIYNQHDCEITITTNDNNQTISVSEYLCRIDLDETIQIWPGRHKHGHNKTTIDYANPNFTKIIISTIHTLLQQRNTLDKILNPAHENTNIASHEGPAQNPANMDILPGETFKI